MADNIRINIPTEDITAFCEKWHVAEFALFGSVLRDDFGADSDIDVLVDLPAGHGLSLLDWVAMIDELTTIFGRKVDLVSKRGLRNPFRRHAILTTREIVHAA